jgi:hypothetical protein
VSCPSGVAKIEGHELPVGVTKTEDERHRRIVGVTVHVCDGGYVGVRQWFSDPNCSEWPAPLP